MKTTSPQPLRMPLQDIQRREQPPLDPQVKQAAQGMEAMFLDHLMQVMRKSVPETELSLESSATKMYRGLLDSEIAKKAANIGGVGLAEQIVEYLTGQRYNLNESRGPASERTGGTNGNEN